MQNQNNHMADFAAQIKKARKRLRCTLEQFGRMIGFSKAIVSKWERRESAPKPITRKAILAAVAAKERA